MPGGKEIHVLELSRVQAKLGDDVHVIYRLGDGSQLEGQATQIRLPARFAGCGSVATLLFSVLAAVQVLRVPRFDTLHVHGDFIEVPALAVAARARRARVVLTVHGALNPRYALAARIIFRMVDHFIALGSSVGRDLEARGVPRARILVISSGLNTQLLDPFASSPDPTIATVAAVGTLDEVKNYDVLIQAMRQLPEGLSGHLYILGDGPDRGRLERLAEDTRRVTFLGRVSREEVYSMVASSQLFVMASKPTATKGEGIPTALLEAMYLGRHCLVSSSALPEPVVTDRRAYDVFDPDDPSSLATLIENAILDPHRSRVIGQRAQRAVAHLDWATVGTMVRDVLRISSARGGHESN